MKVLDEKMSLPTDALRTVGRRFKDQYGRTVLLRGVNVAASAKTPQGQPSWQIEGFWEQAEQDDDMTFVGRTFDLDSSDADIHLTRLKQWGFNCLRYVFTWEAIEHAGPGQYDEAFIRYTLKMLKKCKEYGFKIYMDPHQDLFSRFSGGDGAPYWALLAAGMNPRNFTATIAAHLQAEWPSTSAPKPREFPDMIWATGYQKLAVQTLNTLFWAGRDFAPKCIINNVNIQDYLQKHYIDAVGHLARSIADFEDGTLLDSCVIGWDSINEPNAGYITIEDLSVHSKESVLKKGPMPTAFQAMQLGMGQPCSVENWIFTSTGPKQSGETTVDPQGARAWLSAEKDAQASKKYGWKRDPGWTLGTDVWALHGVWDPDQKVLLKKDYFQRIPGSKEDVEFGATYWTPHFERYAQTLRASHPLAILFVHTPVFQVPPVLKEKIDLAGRAAFSTHFYDGVTLVTKHWNWFNYDAIGFLRGKYRYQWQAIRVGETAIRKILRDQLGVLKQDGQDCIGDYPVMMGEIGIPFDLDRRKSYETGDYSNQLRALDASLNACDGKNALNVTMWTYCPDNTHRDGDQWDGEDLSIWSVDDQTRQRRSYMPREQRETSSAVSTSPAVSIIDLPTMPTTPLLARTDAGGQNTTLLDLNDGARALPAFCRPYPMACVGELEEFEFDLRSSVFTLEVKISADDVIDPTQPTVVFVPLVHYATKPRSVAQAIRDEFVSDQALADRLKHDKHEIFPFKQSASLFAHHQRFNNPGIHVDDLLAVEVEITSGMWRVEGQLLKWYYDKPASGSKIERISIRRAGGAVPSWAELYGHGSLWSTALGNVWSSVRTCIPANCIVS